MEAKQITEERFIELMACEFPTFKITKSNLTYPTSQFVSTFYSLILKYAIDLNDPDEIWNLTEDQRSYINSYHPETTTFVQHVWAHNLHSAVKYVFSQLRQSGTEFFFSDILFPENTPRRTFVFMTLMLHFYWYMNDFEAVLNDDMSACLKEVQVIESLKAEKERLLLQVQQHKDQKMQYAESSKNKKTSITKCSELIEETENVMKELIAKQEMVMKDLEKVEDEEQQLQDTLTKLQNEKKYLESLVVSNQNQVVDIHTKNLTKKDEHVKKIKTLEEQVKSSSSKLIQSNKVLELQQKLNSYLKEETQGKSKGLKSLFETINFLRDKKTKLTEDDSSMKVEILESEEAMPRLKSQYSQMETQQQAILSKGKEKTEYYIDLIDTQKKRHAQLLSSLMKKDTQEIGEFEFVSPEMSEKCNEIEEILKNMDSENKERYFEYVKKMTSALSSVQEVFGEDIASRSLEYFK